MQDRAGVVLVSFTRAGRMLTAWGLDEKHREIGDWGGRIEEGEDAHEAASRELEEESLGLFRLSPEYIRENTVASGCVWISTIFFVPVPMEQLLAFPMLFQDAYQQIETSEMCAVKLMFDTDVYRACVNDRIYSVVRDVLLSMENFLPHHGRI